MTTHLAELIRRFAYELFSRQEAVSCWTESASKMPRVVEDLVPKLLPLATVQRVIQNLLRERVSIRDAVSILEALGEGAPRDAQSGAADGLRPAVDPARRRKAVPQRHRRSARIFPRTALERFAEGGVEHGESNSSLALAPNSLRDLLDRLAAASACSNRPL